MLGLRLTGATGDTEPAAVADQLHRVLVDLHQADGVNVGQDPAVEPARSDLPETEKAKRVKKNGKRGGKTWPKGGGEK